MKDSKKMIVGAVLYTLFCIRCYILESYMLPFVWDIFTHFSGYMLRWFLLCLQGFRICI